MKTLIYIILATSLVAISGLLYLRYSSEEKTAFVSSEKIFTDFEGKRELSKELNLLETQHQHILDSLTLAMRSTVDESEKAQQYRLFQRLKAEFVEEEAGLAKSYTDRIWTQINAYTQEYAQQQGYTYLFGARQDGTLMYALDSKDITAEVLTYINERYRGE